MNMQAYNATKDADDTAYARHRDTVGDNQWKYEQANANYWNTESYNQWATEQNNANFWNGKEFSYQQARDKVADNQWSKEFNYQKSRDKVADKQWSKEYELSKKATTGSRSSSTTGKTGNYKPYTGTKVTSGNDKSNGGMSIDELLKAAKK
jgi:hypothetical protein